MRKPGEALTTKELKEAVQAFQLNDFSQTKAAAALKLPRATLQGRLREAETRGLLKRRVAYVDQAVDSDDIIFPDLPSSELPAEQLIEQACKRFESHLHAREARRWMEIKVKSNKPIGIAFVGDPHIDNNGCNWPLLNRDIKLLENTEGLYAVNIGDLTDNWVGRLVRLYADQEMSKKQAWKLAAWFLKETKIKWLCHVMGNHDSWADGQYLIKANAAPKVPVEDWQSRFQIVFPNDQRIRVHVAHDFPGNSQWNEMHGAKKASMLNEQADIYACGHKHQWAINEGENANRDFIYWLIRARGYKFIDSYADQLGFPSQKYGASITAIIDPTKVGPQRIRCFPDLLEASEFLHWKRSKK